MMNVGWARDEEAGQIQALLAADGLFLEGGDWRGLGKTWLCVRDGEKILACIAYHPGIPFARLDYLSIDRDVAGLSKARVVRSILEAAFAVCALHGSSFVSGVVPYDLPDYAEFLRKRGGQQINEGFIFVASLSDVLKRRNEVYGRLKNNHDDEGRAHS
ncbi:MAG: hypothetical protein E6Q97_10300 [Desulfurellales bacterium]|nr:MAG: hypothetical protein E6Q97_10300 [Desulfurellales bacterium]